jgi:lysosomal Pro-X carboxypeptidase
VDGGDWVRAHPEAPVLPSTANCTIHYKTQPLDHFSFSVPHTGCDATFRQRYFVYDAWHKPGGPIWFYCGNEAPVTLYVNATGLMWQNAEAFGALLVFAEHRFYGASVPKCDNTKNNNNTINHLDQASSSAGGHPYLSHELALADYGTLIADLRTLYAPSDPRTPVIAFGGSYGGKLAAWLRMKYPSAVAGAISASAPLLAFQGERPSWDSESYYRVVTRTAAHYHPSCASNVRAAFKALDGEGATAAGRARLQQDFALCSVPSTTYKVDMLRFFIRDAFDSIAMGNCEWERRWGSVLGDHCWSFQERDPSFTRARTPAQRHT